MPVRKLLGTLAVAAVWAALTGCGGAAPKNTPAPAPPVTTDGGIRFSDAIKTSGIDYKWSVRASRPLNILGTIGNGCAFLDYDNDGKLDILFIGAQIALYHNDGNGHFSDVTKPMGLDKLKGYFLGCTIGDYDNDGFEDIYVTAYQGGVLLHNDGGKQFRDVTPASGLKPQPWGSSACFVDIDGDGLLDLYVANYAQFTSKTQPQLCNSSGTMTSCGPRLYLPIKGVLYRNLGAGRFKDVTKEWGADRVHGRALGVAATDYNNSGRQSISIANDELEGDLLTNEKNKFKESAAQSLTAFDLDGKAHGGMGTDWGDYDNDGKQDLVVATFQHEAKCLYHNDGDGQFSERATQQGMTGDIVRMVAFGVKFIDCDNDGWLDLIFANGHVQDNIDAIDKSTTYRQPPLLHRNLAGHGFADISATAGSAFTTPIVGRGLAIGDYDNDGKMDMLIVNSEGAPQLLHNDTATKAHWLSVKLRGRRSNRDGIGALVTVEAGATRRTRRCATDGSYMSASDRRIHFGLGDLTGPVTVRVSWPTAHGGKRETVHSNIQIDREVTLDENASGS